MKIHLTNVSGMGAVRLVSALLPHLLRREHGVSTLFVGDPVVVQCEASSHYEVVKIPRRLPHFFSRGVEVFWGGDRFRSDEPMLTLGDVPIRGVSRQTVFVQSSFIITSDPKDSKFVRLRAFLLRLAFYLNRRHADRFIVQSVHMARGLSNKFGIGRERIFVIPQPPPYSAPRRPGTGRKGDVLRKRGLRLFYPARGYPHKNHRLLALLPGSPGFLDSVESVVLTVPEREHPRPGSDWIRCIGEVELDRVYSQYDKCDALLFLSREESLGLPLIEAMCLGLPIICPDREYARSICGDGAYYFDPDSPESLVMTVDQLRRDISLGRLPDWSRALAMLPSGWDEVAQRMVRVCLGLEGGQG